MGEAVVEQLREDHGRMTVEGVLLTAPRLVAERAGTDGHADRFWAMALAVLGANSTAGPFRARVAGTPSPARAARGGRPGHGIDPAAGMVRSRLDPIRSWRM